jgi:hypothetical protein
MLGFSVQRGTGRGERYFELAGVPQPLLDRWSSRHHQVQAAIRDRLSATERDLRAVISEGGPAAADAHERLELLIANGQLAPAEERLMGRSPAPTRSRSPQPISTLSGGARHDESGSRPNGSRCCAATSANR